MFPIAIYFIQIRIDWNYLFALSALILRMRLLVPMLTWLLWVFPCVQEQAPLLPGGA